MRTGDDLCGDKSEKLISVSRAIIENKEHAKWFQLFFIFYCRIIMQIYVDVVKLLTGIVSILLFLLLFTTVSSPLFSLLICGLPSVFQCNHFANETNYPKRFLSNNHLFELISLFGHRTRTRMNKETKRETHKFSACDKRDHYF